MVGPSGTLTSLFPFESPFDEFANMSQKQVYWMSSFRDFCVVIAMCFKYLNVVVHYRLQ